jgi:hypothetical protein
MRMKPASTTRSGARVDLLAQGGIELVARGIVAVGTTAVAMPCWRRIQAAGVGAVADDGGDSGRPPLGLCSTDDGFHIAASSGNQDDNASHGVRIVPADGLSAAVFHDERPAWRKVYQNVKKIYWKE